MCSSTPPATTPRMRAHICHNLALRKSYCQIIDNKRLLVHTADGALMPCARFPVSALVVLIAEARSCHNKIALLGRS